LSSGFRYRRSITNQNRGEQMLVENFERRAQNPRLFGFREHEALPPFFGAGANVSEESHFQLYTMRTN